LPRSRPWPAYRRNLEGAWKAIDHLRDQIDRLDRADEIAEKVSEALHRERFLTYTVLQKTIATACAGLLILVNVLVLFGVHL
jgi:hypothetical protein